MKTTMLSTAAFVFAAAATAAPLAPPQSPVQQPAPTVECVSQDIEIYFEQDSTAVTPQAQKVIDARLTEIASCDIDGVIIEAHTDAEGDQIANVDLATARAAAVVGALNFTSQADPQIRIVPVGEQYATFNTGSEKIMNRKAIVHLIMEEPIFSVASIDY